MGKKTVERGYGARHKALRRMWERRVVAGGVARARCSRLIVPGERWDLDHTDDRSGYLGPSHARCNRSSAYRRRQSSVLRWSLGVVTLVRDEWPAAAATDSGGQIA